MLNWVEELTENPYMQFFIGLPGYKVEPPFVPSLLVEFRKRLDEDTLSEINEMIIDYNRPKDPPPGTGSSGNADNTDPQTEDDENSGTLILDATCAPSNIAYPQDINLLNKSREELEGMIDFICGKNHIEKPRTYRKNARQDYLNIAKCKRRTAKKMRKAIPSNSSTFAVTLGIWPVSLKPMEIYRKS